MAAMGFTLNQITMLALTLMVGIVIDDAIIVLENIFRFMEEKDMPPFQAAIEGTKEIGLAVMATTLSLLAVFLPVGFMGGIVGRFMSSFGFTSAFAIAVSLLVSFTLTPMLCSRFMKPPRECAQSHHSSKESLFLPFLDTYYTAHAEVVHGAPQDDGRAQRAGDSQHRAAVHVRGQKLSAARTTNRNTTCWCARRKARRWPPPPTWPSASRRISAALPGVQHTLMTAGGSADQSVNNAAIYVKLTDIDQRKVSQSELMQRTRDLMKKYPHRDSYRRRTGEHRRRQPEQRRRPVLHPGPRSRQAGASIPTRCWQR